MEQEQKGRTGRDSHESVGEQRVPALSANVGSDSNFKAMNGDNPRAESALSGAGEFPRTTGVEVGEAKGLNEMETKPSIKKLPTNEAFCVSAADLADKIIILMQHGFAPLFLSTSTWALVQTSRCQAIN
jgi:hypothetical protein